MPVALDTRTPSRAGPTDADRLRARDEERPVVLCPWDSEEDPGHAVAAAAATLARQLRWRLSVVELPPGGSPAEGKRQLCAAAARERAALIVVDRRTADDELASLARWAPCPIVSWPLDRTRTWEPGGPVLCGIDGSASSTRVARWAVRLATGLDARLVAVHVEDAGADAGADGDAADRRRSRVRAFRGACWQALHSVRHAPSIDARITSGEAAAVLTSSAEREEASLLVVGAPDVRSQIGGVGRTVVARSRLPVVVVAGDRFD